MSEVVVDTNVWVLADRITSINAETPAVEADCIEACYRWIQQFSTSGDRLVVDRSYRIFREYRNNISNGGLAEQELNRLESMPLERLVYVDIEFDKDGHAIVPAEVMIRDESDRKFVAVAIASEPFAPIYNATETDWTQEQESLSQFGLMSMNSARTTLSRECSSASSLIQRSDPANIVKLLPEPRLQQRANASLCYNCGRQKRGSGSGQ